MSTSRLKVTYYKNLLLSMNVAKHNGEIIIAKPIMLLTLLSLIEDGELIGNKFLYDDRLIARYKNLFFEYKPTSFTSPIYPFYYLNSEEFYMIKGDTSRRTPSTKFLRENVEFAAFDDELWELLQDSAVREEFRDAIIRHFLS